MVQVDAFNDELNELKALKRDCDVIGFKTIASMLKPTIKDPEDAAKWLNNCFDPKRKEKPDVAHITVIVNEARKAMGFSEYLHYLNDKTWHEPPVPKRLGVEAERLGKQLDQLNTQAKETIDYLIEARKELGDA